MFSNECCCNFVRSAFDTFDDLRDEDDQDPADGTQSHLQPDDSDYDSDIAEEMPIVSKPARIGAEDDDSESD